MPLAARPHSDAEWSPCHATSYFAKADSTPASLERQSPECAILAPPAAVQCARCPGHYKHRFWGSVATSAADRPTMAAAPPTAKETLPTSASCPVVHGRARSAARGMRNQRAQVVAQGVGLPNACLMMGLRGSIRVGVIHKSRDELSPMLSTACACADPAVKAACAAAATAVCRRTPANARGRLAACGADWAAAYTGGARSAALQTGFGCVLTDFEDHPLAVLQVGTCGMLMAAAPQASCEPCWTRASN